MKDVALHFRWKCPHCRQTASGGREQLVAQLRDANFLKRASKTELADVRYLLSLAASIRDRLTCPSCGGAGYLPALHEGQDDVEDRDEDWGQSRPCLECGQLIPAERLELFPDMKLCVACQGKSDRGESDDAPDYCPHCGTPRTLRQSRAGISRYEAYCPQCRK